MFELQSPLFLLALPLIPLVAWMRHRARPRMRFSSLELVEPGPSLRRILGWLPEALFLLGLLSGLIALARPQLTHRETVVKSQGIDIMLAIDTSGSMESPDYVIGGRRTSRLNVARAVMIQFIQGRPYDRIGLVVFGEEAFTQVPLTLDHDALVAFLREVDIGMAGEKATAIGEGLGLAVRRLKDLEAPSKVVILLTDGQNNAGRLSPDQAAEAAAALGIRVHTIGVGSRNPAKGLLGLQQRGELDEASLQRIAATTGGRYFRADDTDTLAQVYATIDQMEKTTAEVKEYVHREERFLPWLVVALSAIAAHAALAATLFRRLP